MRLETRGFRILLVLNEVVLVIVFGFVRGSLVEQDYEQEQEQEQEKTESDRLRKFYCPLTTLYVPQYYP